MFCTECGQALAEGAKFCAYCGTRRAIPAADAAVPASPAAPPPKAEPSVSAPPAPVRTIRSTAEIMPIRMQRSAPPPPPTVQEDDTAETEEPDAGQSVVPWPAEGSTTPSLFTTAGPPPVRLPEPVRATTPTPAAHEAVPTEAQAPAAERYAAVPFAAPPGSHDVGERRKMSPVLIGAIIVALIAVAGIVWMLRSSISGAGGAAAKVEITIYPTTAKVVAGKSADFAATVTGAPASEVTWSLDEGAAGGQIQPRPQTYPKDGTVTFYAAYTAPKTPGTYHLLATSKADTSKSATSEITVTAK